MRATVVVTSPVGAEPDEQAVTLAQVVAALSVTYNDAGVMTWLTARNRQFRVDGWVTTAQVFIEQNRMAEVADAVRRIGDADPADFAVAETGTPVAEARAVQAEQALTELREWAFTIHGGTKSPADVWPRLRAILAASSGSVTGEQQQ